MEKPFVYRNEYRNEISFPIGGIGSGCVGLSGTGRLVDWEIFNKPNKGSILGFSHIAVKAEKGDQVLDARVLNADLAPPYSGSLQSDAFGSFGFGPPRGYLTGMPHFDDCTFTGTFPTSQIDFHDDRFPGEVSLHAFNPFIPLNDRDSSIPAAFFEVVIKNPSADPITYTVCFSLENSFGRADNENVYQTPEGHHVIQLSARDIDCSAVEYGDMSVATDSEDVSYQEYWYRGRWFDNLSVFWQDFSKFGHLPNRSYDSDIRSMDSVSGQQDQCSLAAHIEVAPGQSRAVRFVVSWNYPNVTNYWNPEKCGEDGCCSDAECTPSTWKNYYATIFENSTASAVYALSEWDRLQTETNAFRDTLFSSTLPDEVIDAVSANISILKSPTVLRLEDGTLYGFEGCHPSAGCCEGSCTHVWNYAYALPFLFPSLERSMRDADFAHNMDDDGGMHFRLQLPLGRERNSFRPCADGQFGGIMKIYREWKICGDTEWLKSHWESIKKNIEYAWSDSNPDKWDRDKDGVLEGRQHHTLDMELFGPNSWLTGFYLGALSAAAEMAAHLADYDAASEYTEIYDRGRSWVNEHLFNGSYFAQRVDIGDKKILEVYDAPDAFGWDKPDNGAVFNYWSDEHQEIKYQVADGCGVDQVIAQWHAKLMGLPAMFDGDKVKKALSSIYQNNFIELRDHINPCRIYALNDEQALIICSYPGERPVIPIPYAEEAMNGFEYQAACHMIQEDLVEEGLNVVRAVRNRYDGRRRNPWNEFECGSNYARSMASYSLLLSLSGFEYDMVKGHIGFAPLINKDRFHCLFSLDAAWGEISIGTGMVSLTVKGGEITLNSFACSAFNDRPPTAIHVGGNEVAFTRDETAANFADSIKVSSASPLVCVLGS